MWTLIVVLVVTSGIGLFYYLRIVVAMHGWEGEAPYRVHAVEPLSGVTLELITAALILLGLFPRSLLNAIRSVIADLV